MNTNPWFSRVFPLLLVAGSPDPVAAGVAPVTLAPESFTADVVVEQEAQPALVVSTTASVDGGTANSGYTWFEQGFHPTSPDRGLPPAGTTFTAAGNVAYSFQMPSDYTAPNAVVVDAASSPNPRLTLVTPAAYARLSLLGSSGNGTARVTVTVEHADGATQTGSLVFDDWFDGTSGLAWIAHGRVTTADFVLDTQSSVLNPGNPRLYYRDLVLTETNSPVVAIELACPGATADVHTVILALSGATPTDAAVRPIVVTGLAADVIVEAAAAHPGSPKAVTGARATSQSMTGSANNGLTWYERGYNRNNPGSSVDTGTVAPPLPDVGMAGTGLPPAGSTLTNATGDRIYLLPPDYQTNNACFLSVLQPAGAVRFAAPTRATLFSLLAAAGGGSQNLEATLHHEDGSTETQMLVVPGWLESRIPGVWNVGGAVDVLDAGLVSDRTAEAVPRLHGCDLVPANSVSPVTQLDLRLVDRTAAVAIFAVSSTIESTLPTFVKHPQSATLNPGQPWTLTGVAAASLRPVYQWQRRIEGTYVDLADDGRWSGVASTNLTCASLVEADEGEYRLMASNAGGSAVSAVATLIVLCPLPDVTVPSDPITALINHSPAGEVVRHAIDDGTDKYLNFDARDEAAPFVGPVGFVVKPTAGLTRVTALRLYAANDATERDPAVIVVEGSLDRGATYALVVSNRVAMPTRRNNAGLALNPLTQSLCQLRFDNPHFYATYRVQFPNVRNDSTANSVQIGEIELLGVKQRLALDVAASEEPATLGTPFRYTLQFTNRGPGAVPDVWLTNTLPAGLLCLAAQTSQGAWAADGQRIVCHLGDVPAGATPAITIEVFPAATGTFTNQIVVSPDVDGGDVAERSMKVVTQVRSAFQSARFAATNVIDIPQEGTATPYPATLEVTQFTGRVDDVTATLHGLFHDCAADLDVLLVGPTGRRVLLMTYVGAYAEDVDLTFDDLAPSSLPDGNLSSGTWRPTIIGDPNPLTPPAPGLPYGSRLAAFAGQDPHGLWRLYVNDVARYDPGEIAGGWSLELRQTTTPVPLLLPPRLENGQIVLAVPTVVDVGYTVEHRPALGDGDWAPLASFVGDGTVHTLSDPTVAGARYYRVRTP